MDVFLLLYLHFSCCCKNPPLALFKVKSSHVPHLKITVNPEKPWLEVFSSHPAVRALGFLFCRFSFPVSKLNVQNDTHMSLQCPLLHTSFVLEIALVRLLAPVSPDAKDNKCHPDTSESGSLDAFWGWNYSS